MRLDTFLISYSDSSFTNPHEVALPQQPENRAGQFTHMGAQYWGFETKRHDAWTLHPDSETLTFSPTAQHELVLGLKQPAIVDQIDISTRWFTGNQVPAVSIELIRGNQAVRVVDRHQLEPDAEVTLRCKPTEADKCRVLCHQEGGISSISLFGDALQDRSQPINLLESATISSVSNAHYGHPADAIAGVREVDHMRGWESARGSFGEHAVFHFDQPVTPSTLVVDTYLHRLNPPLCCQLFALPLEQTAHASLSEPILPKWEVAVSQEYGFKPVEDLSAFMSNELAKSRTDQRDIQVRMGRDPSPWTPITGLIGLCPDTYHEEATVEGFTTQALLFVFFPNGGIHGLKVYGDCT